VVVQNLRKIGKRVWNKYLAVSREARPHPLPLVKKTDRERVKHEAKSYLRGAGRVSRSLPDLGIKAKLTLATTSVTPTEVINKSTGY